MHIFFLIYSNSFSSLLLLSALLFLSSSPSGFLLTSHYLLPPLANCKHAQYFSSYKIFDPLSPELPWVLPVSTSNSSNTVLSLTGGLILHLGSLILKDRSFTPQQSFSRSAFGQNLESGFLSLLRSLFWVHSQNLVFCDCFHGASHFSTHSAFSSPRIFWKSHPKKQLHWYIKFSGSSYLLLQINFLVTLKNTVWDKLKITKFNVTELRCKNVCKKVFFLPPELSTHYKII